MEAKKKEEIKSALASFYMGPVYPIVVCFLMFIAYVSSSEVYITAISFVILAVGLLVTKSIRPFIPVCVAYIYQFSPETGIMTPEGLSRLLSGWRLVLNIFSFGLLIFALGYCLVKNKLVTKKTLLKIPFPFAALALSVAFLLNGAFSDTASFTSFSYGVAQVITFFGFFYLVYYGIKNDNGRELASYLSYVSALVCWLILANVFVFALSADNIIVDGSFVRNNLLPGFGNVNTIGQNLAVLIPMIFYGVMKNRYPWFYLVTSVFCMCGIAITLSRNAWLFGGIAFVACFIACAFVGRNKKIFRILVPLSAIIVIAVLVFCFEDIYTLFKYNFDRGFSDNGRYALWKIGFDNFLEAPIFGKGFYGVKLYEEFCLPSMVHNTVIQLLCSTGVVGLIAYGYYRVETARPFLKKPTLEKTMLGASVLIVILGSLLDIFIFYIPHMLYYPVALAIAFKIADEQKQEAMLISKGIISK